MKTFLVIMKYFKLSRDLNLKINLEMEFFVFVCFYVFMFTFLPLDKNYCLYLHILVLIFKEKCILDLFFFKQMAFFL